MAKPYSMDLRERALARLEEGETSREVAAALKVAVSSVIKCVKRLPKLTPDWSAPLGVDRSS
jgi:putative transposase